LSLFQGRMDNMKKKKGQALVEIALALPILALLLLTIVDFGRILYAGVTLNMISQEAARYASFGKSKSDIETYVWNNSLLSNSNTITVELDPPTEPRKSGEYVKVTLTYNINFINPLLKIEIPSFPSPFPVSSNSTIRVE
jgi:hypothetical protein